MAVIKTTKRAFTESDADRLGLSSVITHLTVQASFTPEPAVGGRWRWVTDRDLQNGLTMTNEDFVIFRNCRFDGHCQFTTCDNLRFEDCTSNDVEIGTGVLTFDGCEFVDIDFMTIDDASFDGIQLVDTAKACQHFTINKLYITTCCSGAPVMTESIVRGGAFEYSQSFKKVTRMHSGISMDGAIDVTIRDCRINGSSRGGIYMDSCDTILIENARLQDCGSYRGSGVPKLDDSPIFIQDSVNVAMKGGFVKNFGRKGIMIHESVPAFDPSNTIHTTRNVRIDGVLVEGYATDSLTDGSKQEGIISVGGKYITVENCEVRHCGETGIRMGHVQPATYIRALNNWSHDNGLSTGAGLFPDLGTFVHRDGISISGGYGALIGWNVCDDNHRQGIQLKHGFLSLTESVIDRVMMIGNITRGNGFNHSGEANGTGLAFVGDPSAYMPGQNVTVLGHISDGNALANLSMDGSWNDVQYFGVQIGWCDGESNILIEQSDRVDFFGGVINGWYDQTGGAYSLHAIARTDGDVTDCRLIGTSFVSLDTARESREIAKLAYDNAPVDPITDDFTESMAIAATVSGKFMHMYHTQATASTITANSTTAVLGATAGTSSSQNITAGITDPNLSITPNAARTTTVTTAGALDPVPAIGAVTVNGTDQDDASVSENFIITGSPTTFTGTQTFKTVTSVDIPASVPPGATVAVGTGWGTYVRDQNPSAMATAVKPGQGAGGFNGSAMFLDADVNATNIVTAQIHYVQSAYYDNDVFLANDASDTVGIIQSAQKLLTDGNGAAYGFDAVDGVHVGNGFGPTFIIDDIPGLPSGSLDKITDMMPAGEWILNTSGIKTESPIYIVDSSGPNIAQVPTPTLSADQAAVGGAVPVLTLIQADVDQDMIELDTTIGTGNAIEAVAAKSLTTTHFVKLTIPGSLTRYFPVGTIA